MHAHVFCASTYGIEAHIVDVEVHCRAFSIPSYHLVGLADRAITESYVRIDTAIRSCGLAMPEGRKIVSLAPADLPKEGSAFDLPIAVGLLAVSGLVDRNRLQQTVIMGELALDGSLRPIKGVLPVAIEAKNRGFKYMIIPKLNGNEAAVVKGLQVYALSNLQEVITWFNVPNVFEPDVLRFEDLLEVNDPSQLDYCDVKGQETAKRALEVAAAGGHNIVLVGPPGSGKTMLARRIPGILPPMSLYEALETTKIHSVSGLLLGNKGLVTRRPFRAPHHTVSATALVGGGGIPMPGEISLAHNGVLFLDELPEFPRNALEVLRQPLEDGYVSISRAKMSVVYPSRFMFVASMNPSPSGGWTSTHESSEQAQHAVKRYLSKISGPLLDRIDLHIEVNKVSFDELTERGQAEQSMSIRSRIIKARSRQLERFKHLEGIYCNAQMTTRMVRSICEIDQPSATMLKKAMELLGLSARAYDRILKVARSIADIADEAKIKPEHIAEAIQYRSLDREGWNNP